MSAVPLGAAAPGSHAFRPTLADAILDRFQATGSLAHRSTWAANAALVLTGAAIVGLLAQASIPLWPVPITGQTLGVLVVGAAFGARRGAAAMMTYAGLGLAGLPWFANLTGGLAAFAKPSFGYIIGFIPAAFLIGYLSERRWDRRPLLSVAAFGAATLVPFVFGVPYLWAVLNLGESSLTWGGAFAAGFTPFILGGIIKWAIGAVLLPTAWRFLERRG